MTSLPDDQKLIAALQEIATEIRTLRIMLVSIISPALRDDEGIKTSDGYLRTQQMPEKK